MQLTDIKGMKVSILISIMTIMQISGFQLFRLITVTINLKFPRPNLKKNLYYQETCHRTKNRECKLHTTHINN